MKLRLRITKMESKDYTKPQYRMAVIDLDKSKKYPQNFVCILPKNIKLKAKPSNIFEKMFGKDSIDVAKQLLKKTLRSRPDSETKNAIRERLNRLEPKPANKARCQACGKPFKQFKRRFRAYKLCYECHQKRYTKK